MLSAECNVLHPSACRTRRIPGGSAANVAKGLAGLSAGRRPVAFVGMLGRDAAGMEYRKKLAAQGVDTRLLLESGSGAPSASCLCLVRAGARLGWDVWVGGRP